MEIVTIDHHSRSSLLEGQRKISNLLETGYDLLNTFDLGFQTMYVYVKPEDPDGVNN